MTIPDALLKGVYANQHARDLLLLLYDAGEPVRYSRAREQLDLHPQQFQRAYERLSDLGLVGWQAPADLNRPHAERVYVVQLVLSPLGEFAALVWRDLSDRYVHLAGTQGVPSELILGAFRR